MHVLPVMILRPVVDQRAPVATVIGIHRDRPETILPSHIFRHIVFKDATVLPIAPGHTQIRPANSRTG